MVHAKNYEIASTFVKTYAEKNWLCFFSGHVLCCYVFFLLVQLISFWSSSK